jgi:plasmid stabilization system protein ParE
MARVAFASRARRSLFDTLTCIARDNPTAAVNLIRDLERRVVDTLGIFPDSGARWRGDRRVMTIRRYAFVYRHDAAKGEVVVLDVFGPGMDWR